MSSSLPFDPIAEAYRQWRERWPEYADRMAAITSVMRAQQLLLAEAERVLKPHGLTFAAYEALQLLSFTRSGALPMGKMGERLMVHPASVTNAIDRLESRGLVVRRPSPDDRRRVLAEITRLGRTVAAAATESLNASAFGLGGVPEQDAVELTRLLRRVRAGAGDFADDAHDPWAPNEVR